MRISDWSSDVCSSDLPSLPDLLPGLRGRRRAVPAGGHHLDGVAGRAGGADAGRVGRRVRPAAGLRHAVPEPAGDAADPADPDEGAHAGDHRSEEHTSELQSLMRTSYAALCMKTKNK